MKKVKKTGRRKKTGGAVRDEPDLEARLGYRFSDPRWLERALTHRSFAYERTDSDGEHYERLEFLGDALLGFVVTDWLWRDDPDAAEGVLSRRKQAVVRSETLARASRGIGLGDALRLGRGEESTGGRAKLSLLADVFEAVTGAIYADGGLRPTRAFIVRHLGAGLRATRRAEHVADDYKTRLQEKVQGAMRVTPRYRIVSVSGPPHAREFSAEVLIGDDVRGSGCGPSRKQAEQQAARDALQRWGSGLTFQHSHE